MQTSSEMDVLLAEDASARARSLDVASSFIVQAPAGSGKTELLIQRYLALLATVDEPSHIIALTFTRKAAGEMRERVQEALLEAERDAPVEDFDHARMTRQLAKAALLQNQRQGWALTEHPARLRMETFDALATSFARRAPIAAGLGPGPDYLDDAGELYLRAAESALCSARADDANWKLLLLHLDNQAPQVARSLQQMLERRSQWLRAVIGVPAATLKDELETALRADIVRLLVDTRAAFPASSATDIRQCALNAAEVFVQGDEEERAFACALEASVRAGGIPPAEVDALSHWRTLDRFLMVRSGPSFRKLFNIGQGFEPASKGSGSKESRIERKRAMESLCRRLESVPGLASALKAAGQLPEPRISDEAWRIVEALLAILQNVAAELSRVFASERRVDFLQANLAALDALGEPDAPSELLLQLDASVRHLLVDEFQDTSILQLELVKRLTAGWSPGDGRTLFVVGDPMQSIYRFRDAEVAFFLEAQQRGSVADVPVERLALRRNFRSQANIVEWCNTVFDDVLGRVRDPVRSVVPFEPAVPHRDACEGITPALKRCESAAEEAAWVVEIIRQAQADGAKDIAVLVRARAHLAAILPALRRAGITFVAVELDLLSQRQAVRDLAALTHALLQPADRLAWLAALRAPWCGLTLHDLVAITIGGDRAGILPQTLDDLDAITALSDDGRARLRRALAVLNPALASRGRANVVDRVRGAWLALGAPACLDDALDLDTATLFFDLLSSHERGGDVPDWEAFVAALGSLHASPAASHSGGVQVMTMHKAKGLEFDTVIVTGLAQEIKRSPMPLLRYRRRDAGLIIAPAKSRGGEMDPVYAYLARLESEEEGAELGRLLYVACTRAKTRLHLIAAPGTQIDKATGALSWKDPPAGTSLAKLSHALPAELAFDTPSAGAIHSERSEPPALRRLSVDARLAKPDAAIEARESNQQLDPVTPPFDWAHETTRRIGTLAHRLLARIADDGLAAWTSQRIDALEPRVRAELTSLGFSGDELPSATARVLAAVRRTLDDPRGRWLFDAKHSDARSEWAIAGVDADAIVHVVVDRTFVVDGTRWIVDFKTGSHEGSDVTRFLDNEVERYRGQLARYGRLLSALDDRPVRLALYYPFVEGGFREVTP